MEPGVRIMERTTHNKGRVGLRWWHHSMIVGALGVGAIYLVGFLYEGMLLYYAGPGDPLWLKDIIVWWHVVFGTLLGLGFGVWLPVSLKPTRRDEQKERPGRPSSTPGRVTATSRSSSTSTAATASLEPAGVDGL